MIKIQRLNAERKSYKLKNEYLIERFPEVSPIDFYRDIFPIGSFEKKGIVENKKSNGILTEINFKNSNSSIIFDDLEEIKLNLKRKFIITSCISYAGRRRTSSNARWLYGITIDLDGVNLTTLNDLFYQIKNGFHLMPTYVCNSGHGLHIYYIFKEPIALYKHTHEKLRLFKYEIISNIWNRFTSTLTERNEVQYQGIFQGFRMVGTQTKLGKNFLVRAFKTGEKIDIFDLNNFIHDESKKLKKEDFHYKSKLSLEEAKEKYPEWYEKRIIRGEKKGRWIVKRALYDWWLNKIKTEIKIGHRYSALTVLVSYAIKCNISKKEVKKDCYDLMPILDRMSDTETNRFTEKDVKDALNFYRDSYVNFSRNEVERVSGLIIPANKRNFRTQEMHLKGARAIRDINNPNWRLGNGRKKGSGEKKDIVLEWRKNNPNGKKIDCERITGLSRHTVLKWWNFKEEKEIKIPAGKLFEEEKKVEYWDNATEENIYQPKIFEPGIEDPGANNKKKKNIKK